MPEVDSLLSLEYLAGFFDGEGCVCTGRKKNGTPWLSVSVTQLARHRVVLEEFQRRWGGAIIPQKTRPHHRPCLFWRAITKGGVGALIEMLPYLQVKRRQAILGIRLGKLAAHNVVKGRGHKIQPRDLALRIQIAERISLLNRTALSPTILVPYSTVVHI